MKGSRRTAVRRILILVVALAVVGGSAGGYFLYRRHRVNVHFAHLRAEGMAAAAAGENEKAVQALGAYLGRHSTDVDALAQYAKVRPLVESPQNKHISESIQALRLLLRLQPDRLEDRRSLMKLYARAGFSTEAIDAAEELLKVDAADRDALQVKVETLTELRKYAEALEACKRWSEAAPDSADAQMSLVYLMRRTEQPRERILEVVRKHVAAHPDDVEFKLFDAYALSLLGDEAAAVDRLRELAGSELPNVKFALKLVGHLDRLRLTDESIEVLRKWAPTGDKMVRRTLARRYWEAGRAADLVALLEDLDPNDPLVEPEQVAFKAVSLGSLGRAAEAAPLRQALAARADDVLALAWVAALDLSSEGQGPTTASAALAPLKRAVEAVPRERYLRFFLGDAYARTGEVELAIREWREATAVNGTWVVPAVALAGARLEAGRLDGAIEAAREAISRGPRHLGAVITFVRAWAAGIEGGRIQGEAELLKAIEEVRQKAPDEEQVLVLHAGYLARRGRAEQARQVIRGAIATTRPVTERTWLRLAAVSQGAGLNVEAGCLARSERDHGVTPDLAFARAMQLLVAGKGVEALKAFDEDHRRATAGPEASTRPAGDGVTLAWKLNRAQLMDLAGAPGAARAVMELADAHPSDRRVQQVALAARSTRGEREFLRRTTERLRALTGEGGLAWRIARARWLLGGGQGKAESAKAAREAVALLADVVRQAPESVEGRLLYARALEALDRVPEAINELQAAAELRPDAPSIRLLLCRVLQSRGDFDRAREQMDQLARTKLQSADQRRQAALLYAQQGESRRALEMLEEEARASEQKGSMDLVRASLYVREGRLDQAEAICRDLLEKFPDESVIPFAANLYAMQGKMDDARKALAALERVKLRPGLPELIRADFAARYETPEATLAHLAAGTRAAPKSPFTWRSLVAYHLAFGRFEDAMSAVGHALSAIPGDPTLTAVRQNAAMVRFASSDPSLRQILLAFLRESGSTDRESSSSTVAAESLRLIYAAHESKQSPWLLADRLANLANKHPRFGPLQLRLIQLYDELGRTDDALFVARRTTSAVPESAEAPRMSVEILRRAERWNELLEAARVWRTRLIGDRLPADLAIAEAQLRLNRPAEAVQQLQPYVDAAAAATGDDARRQQAVVLHATALKAVGSTDVASRLEPLLKQGPNGRRAWVAYAIENLSEVEAEVWVRRAETSAPADSDDERFMAGLAWASFADRFNNRKAADRAKELLDEVVRKGGRATTPALLALASRHEKEGDLKGAEALYRRVVGMASSTGPADANLLIASNNLAMVLVKLDGDMNEAKRILGRVLNDWPRVPALHDTLASVEGKAGRYPLALGAMRTAVRLQPMNVEYRLHLVQLLLDSGNRPEAVTALKDLEQLPQAGNRMPEDARRRIAEYRKTLGLASASAN